MKLKDNKIYNVREYTSREMFEVYINKKIEEMRNEKASLQTYITYIEDTIGNKEGTRINTYYEETINKYNTIIKKLQDKIKEIKE